MFPLLEEPHGCPVCASERLRPLHVYRVKPRTQIAQVANLALMGCERCGVSFSHPLPTDAELDNYYSGTYWQERRPEDMDDRTGGRRERIIRLRGIEVDLLAPHLQLPRTRTPTVLDFGCGSGEYLDAFADRGWQTVGLEPGEIGEQTAKRHRMVAEIPAEETFDLVILNHVLEHLKDPVATLERIAAATYGGGYIFASVPNLRRLPEHGRLSYVMNGTHIVSYTLSGLRSVLGLAGYEVVQHFDQPEWDEHHGQKAIRLPVLARNVGGRREPEGEPLAEAIASLLDYAGEQEEPEGERARTDPEEVARLRREKKQAKKERREQQASEPPERAAGPVARLARRVLAEPPGGS